MKNFIGVVLIFSFAFVLSGCAGNNGENSQKTNVVEDINTGSSGNCLNECITLWKSTKNNDGKTEDQIKNECNSLCDAGQGIQKQDISSCDKADGIMKDTCYNDIAKKSNDAAICDKITSGAIAGSCYIDAMERTKDKSFCDKIKTKMFRDDCLTR